MRIYILLLLSAVTALLIGCVAKEPVENIPNERSRFGSLPTEYSYHETSFELSVKSPSFTEYTEDVYIEITNTGTQPIEYGEERYLEKSINGDWYHIPYKENYVYGDILYLHPPGETREFNINPERLVYNISEGKYRMVKTFIVQNGEKVALAAEFSIK